MTELASKGIPAKFASYVDDLGAMLVGDRREQDVHARRRRRHEHLRPGPAVLLGHPGDHAERPDAGPVQVAQGDLPRREDGRPRRLGHRRAEQHASSRKTSSRRSPTAATSTTACTSWCPSAARTSRRCSRRSRPTSPTSCSSATTARTPVRSPTRPSTAGLTAIRIGFEFTPDGLNASKGTYDSDGYTFAYDYFDPKTPDEPAGQVLRRASSTPTNGEDPDFYAANFYENAFVMWELMRRIWAKDPRPRSRGEALDAALQENLTVVSVYGGDERDDRHLHARRDDALRAEARDGRVRVQGRHGHAEGVLRHRRRRLQDGLTRPASRRLEGAVDGCWQSTVRDTSAN